MPRRFDEDRRNKYARSAQAHLAQNPPPATSAKLRETGITPQIPDRG